MDKTQALHHENIEDTAYSYLNRLKITNPHEFRYQLVALLKTIASEHTIERFLDVIHYFRKELINDGYLYVEFLNRIIFGLLSSKKWKLDYMTLYTPCLFISQIGDYYTVELLEKILPYYRLYQDKYIKLQQYTERLKNRLKKLEESLKNANLHPMLDITDHWLN